MKGSADNVSVCPIPSGHGGNFAKRAAGVLSYGADGKYSDGVAFGGLMVLAVAVVKFGSQIPDTVRAALGSIRVSMSAAAKTANREERALNLMRQGPI